MQYIYFLGSESDDSDLSSDSDLESTSDDENIDSEADDEEAGDRGVSDYFLKKMTHISFFSFPVRGRWGF